MYDWCITIGGITIGLANQTRQRIIESINRHASPVLLDPRLNPPVGRTVHPSSRSRSRGGMYRRGVKKTKKHKKNKKNKNKKSRK